MRAAVSGLVALAIWSAALGVAAQDDAPRHLVLDDVFVNDAAWASLTVEGEARASIGGEGALRGEATVSASATVDAPLRASLDVDLVTSIVADRAQRVTMRAVADAIDEVEGVAAGRRYVRDLVIAATDVLVDRGGMQRANVEHLVQTVVRVVLAEIVVRMRFPNASMLDRASYWERRLCSQGTGHRRPSAEGLRHCHRLRMGWPRRDVDEVRVRLYLVDLAYWRLGATGLFGDEPRADPPPCPFRLGTRGGVLCQVLTAGATDDERDRRVDWVLDIPRFESGLAVARALHGRWDSEGSGLRGFLRALVSAREVGAFGETPGLSPFDWDAANDLLRDAVATRAAIKGVFDALDAATRSNGSAASLAAYREAVVALDRRCDATPAACREGGVDAWLDGEIALDGEAREGKVPQLPEAAHQRLQELRMALEGLAERFHDVWSPAEGSDGLLQASERVETATSQVTLRVWREGLGSRLDIGSLPVASLPRMVARLDELVAVLTTVRDAFAAVPPTHWSVKVEDFTKLELSIHALTGTARLLSLFESLNLHSAREAGVATVGSALAGLEALAVKAGDGQLLTPALDLLGRVMFTLERGRAFDTGQLFELASEIDEADVLRALGEDERAARSCEIDEGSLACWTVRIVLSLREAMTIGEGRIAVDGAMFRSTLATLGEDFRARTEWRPYFHLTVGLGQLGTFANAPGTEPTMTDRFRLNALVAEQIGIGIASPSFADGKLTFRGAAFLSGLLYRAVFDNEESDALMVGLAAAVDVYELLQLYVAPMFLFFPGSEDSSTRVLGGLAVGAQVPLGDYLSAL